MSKPVSPTFVEGTGRVVNTIPPSDFSFWETLNEAVQAQPADAMDPEIAGQIAAIGIVKGKPFNPDARMKKILTEALAVGNGIGRAVSLGGRPSEGFNYYGAESNWVNGLFVGGYEFMTPPPEITKDGVKPYPSDGARKLNARLWMFYSITGITPAMCMKLENIGSQYLENFRDSQGNPFDGSKTYKVTLPPKIPAARFWSLTVYDNQTRSMLDTPQRYPRAGSQSYPSPAAEPNADGSTTVYSGPLSLTGSHEAIGSRPCQAKAGSRSFASIARSSRFSTRAGVRARSNWSSELGRGLVMIARQSVSRSLETHTVRESNMSTPNLQFPTPKGFPADRQRDFGSWKLGIGSCLRMRFSAA